MAENRQVLIDSLPDGKLAESNYRMESGPVPLIRENEVLCRTLVITIGAGQDCRAVPAMREHRKRISS